MQVGVPRWPAALAMLAIGLAYALTPDRLRIGPRWGLLIVIAVLLVPLNLVRMRGMSHVTHWLAVSMIALVTVAVGASAVLLVVRLSGGKASSLALLREAGTVWIANVIAFALWYWEIDGGGPAERHMDHHTSTDFLFPQMTLPADAPARAGWAPGFVDYLFLAFNTSSAFSPTDTLILSRKAKVLMMAQSLISLTVLSVLIARAINTLS